MFESTVVTMSVTKPFLSNQKSVFGLKEVMILEGTTHFYLLYCFFGFRPVVPGRLKLLLRNIKDLFLQQILGLDLVYSWWVLLVAYPGMSKVWGCNKLQALKLQMGKHMICAWIQQPSWAMSQNKTITQGTSYCQKRRFPKLGEVSNHPL